MKHSSLRWFIKSFFVVVLCLFFTFCGEDNPLSNIEVGSDAFGYDIAVDGYITSEKSRCIIKITKPIRVNGGGSFEIIKTAQVVLRDSLNTWVFELDEDGNYCSLDSICGIENQNYELEITYNKKVYTAKEVMPPAPNDDFDNPIFYELEDDYSISFLANRHNFGYTNTNIWAWGTFSATGMQPVNYSSLFSKNSVAYSHKGSIPQGSFAPSYSTPGNGGLLTDTLVIVKAELSDSYKVYLADYFNETEWQGSIFSTIQGNIRNNFSSGAVGYFYALNIKDKKYLAKDYVDIK